MKDETRFIVIDRETGTVADPLKIVRKEGWAEHLGYCDKNGFAIAQDGRLILCSDTERFAYCPEDRFTIVMMNDIRGGGIDVDSDASDGVSIL